MQQPKPRTPMEGVLRHFAGREVNAEELQRAKEKWQRQVQRQKRYRSQQDNKQARREA